MSKRKQTKNVGISRREFAKDAAMLAASIALVPSSVLAQEGKASTPLQSEKEPELSPGARAEAEQNFNATMSKYGPRFSDAEKADIHRLLLQQQKSVESVRAYALQNGDEPATVLKLEPGKGR